MKTNKLLYLLSVIATIIVAVISFTLLPESITIGKSEKPRFILILFSLLPILTTTLCIEIKDYQSLAVFLFILIYTIILKTILESLGYVIPLNVIGLTLLILLSLFIALYLNGMKEHKKIAIHLAWIKSEEGFFEAQKKGAKVFFIYSALQTICFILYLIGILSINLTFFIPLIAFALSTIVMLKKALHLD